MPTIYSPSGISSLKSTAFTGYGTAWTQMCYALLRQGFKFVPYSKRESADIYFVFAPTQNFVKHLEEAQPGKNQLVVYMFDWETDSVPERWVKEINEHADIVVTSTPFFVDVYKKSGITKPVLVWQHGVNEKFLDYTQREYKKGDDFYFYHYNAGERRKGWFEIIEAFTQEFSTEKNVKLIAKNSCSGQSFLDFDRVLSKAHDIRNQVIRYEQVLPIDELKALGKKAHCFLFPAYGEGYAMPVNEMMATGIPCILTKAHRFLDLPENIFVPVKTKVEPGRRYYKGTNWWVPDIADLRKQMRWVYENYSQAVEIGNKGYDYQVKSENIDKLCEQFLQNLTEEIKKVKKIDIWLNSKSETKLSQKQAKSTQSVQSKKEKVKNTILTPRKKKATKQKT